MIVFAEQANIGFEKYRGKGIVDNLLKGISLKMVPEIHYDKHYYNLLLSAET